MSSLMDQRVDWTGWAATAAALTCPACGESFQPNHPRRRFCGRDGCPGRTRQRSTAARAPSPTRAARTPRRARRRTRANTNALAGLVADATIELHRLQLTGETREVAQIAAEYVRAVAGGATPAAERTHTVRLLAAAAVRAEKITQ